VVSVAVEAAVAVVSAFPPRRILMPLAEFRAALGLANPRRDFCVPVLRLNLCLRVDRGPGLSLALLRDLLLFLVLRILTQEIITPALRRGFRALGLSLVLCLRLVRRLSLLLPPLRDLPFLIVTRGLTHW
jgi:hypothetical protein